MTERTSSIEGIDLAPFLALRRHLTIAHHIPGRIRLRISTLVAKELGSIDSGFFDRVLRAIDGITDVRVNALAGSLVINYAPGRIEPDWWETLLHGEEATSIALLHQLLSTELAPAVEAALRH